MMVWILGKEREGLNGKWNWLNISVFLALCCISQCSESHSLRSDQLSPQFGVEENQINRDIRWLDQVTSLCWWSQKLKQDWSFSHVEAQAGGVRRYSQHLIWAEPKLSRGQREDWGQRAGKRDRNRKEKGYRPFSTEANTFTQRASASQGKPVITTC